jgi:hypothetical protein
MKSLKFRKESTVSKSLIMMIKIRKMSIQGFLLCPIEAQLTKRQTVEKRNLE